MFRLILNPDAQTSAPRGKLRICPEPPVEQDVNRKVINFSMAKEQRAKILHRKETLISVFLSEDEISELTQALNQKRMKSQAHNSLLSKIQASLAESFYKKSNKSSSDF